MSKDFPYDDRDGFIWFDGEFVPWREAKIHVLNHGLHYGSSVFEGLRIYGGKIFKLTEHSERLRESAKLIGFEVPYFTEELDKIIRETVERQNLKDGYIRPIAWRGSERMAISCGDSTIHVAVACWEWPPYFSEEARTNGLKLTVSKWRRPDPNTAPTTSKASGLYMICTMSKHEAESKGFNDALMLDWRGFVAEATGANFFMITYDNIIHTPIPDCFLDGITRRTVIELAKKRDIEVVERRIHPEELADAREAFVTGTAAEVTPIGVVDNCKFEVGDLTKQLMQDYAELVRR